MFSPDDNDVLLTEVDDFDEEIARIRNQPELMALLKERSKPEQTYGVEEVRRMLGLDENSATQINR